MKLSIIVPTYNVENFIGRCATSIFSQNYDDMEIIFINDCSSDNSENIIFTILEKYPYRKDQVRVVKTEKNSGIAAVRNLGIQLSKGEYIYQVDADDYLEDNTLSKLMELIELKSPDLLLFDYYLNIKNKKISIKNNFVNKSIFLNDLLRGIISPSIWNKIIKKSVIISNNLKFNEGYDYGEDYFFIPLLVDKCNNIIYFDKNIYNYNVSVDNSYTKGISEKKILDLKFNINALKVNFNNEVNFLINEAYIKKIIDFIWKINNFKDLLFLKKELSVFCLKKYHKINLLNKIIYYMFYFRFYFIVYIFVKIRQKIINIKQIINL